MQEELKSIVLGFQSGSHSRFIVESLSLSLSAFSVHTHSLSTMSDSFSRSRPGIRVEIADGTTVVTEVANANDHDRVHLFTYLLTQNMRDDEDMIVGFDTEWSLEETPSPLGKIESSVALIKLCTKFGCYLIRLNKKSPVSASLMNFFLIKDAIFVGVHINGDLKKLREDFGIEVRNAVELSEMAANVLRNPRLSAYGVRDLAGEVLSMRLKMRPLDVIWVDNWMEESLTFERIECATVDAYASYKIGQKLLGRAAGGWFGNK